MFGQFWFERCLVTFFSPKGKPFNLYLPKAELNVVRQFDSLSRTTFQYPHLASTMEKTVAPFNLGKISSRVGVTWCSLWIAALRSLGTRQSLNLLFCLRRLTRLLTQGVGSLSSSFVMMPLLTILSSSLLMSSLRLIGTSRGG